MKRLESFSVQRIVGWDGSKFAGQSLDVRLTSCDYCTQLLSTAEILMDSHPEVLRSLGSRLFTKERTHQAPLALGIVGIKPERVFQMAHSDRMYLRLLDGLSNMGREAMWAQKLVPFVEHGFAPECYSPQPWGYVSQEHRELIRASYARWLRDRIDALQPFDPPIARGCLFCGVGTVMAYSSEAGTVWGPVRKAVLATLGGITGPEPVPGHLCPNCSAAVKLAGAAGMSALERAVLAHQGKTPISGAPKGNSGLKAWATLPSGSTPNIVPWSHIRDIAGIVAELTEP